MDRAEILVHGTKSEICAVEVEPVTSGIFPSKPIELFEFFADIQLISNAVEN